MKSKHQNPYATNKGGKIEAPRKPSANDPHVVRTSTGAVGDLRGKRGKQ